VDGDRKSGRVKVARYRYRGQDRKRPRSNGPGDTGHEAIHPAETIPDTTEESKLHSVYKAFQTRASDHAFTPWKEKAR
jgi:DNA topoisomerase IA